jgi:capsular polysaccharide transport system permease protein
MTVPSRFRSIGRAARSLDKTFAITVAIPTLLAICYFGFIASDRYISESRFVVRNPQKTVPSGLGALLQGTSLSRSQDDTYSVHDFILSRDALGQVEEKLRFRQEFGDPNIDIFGRFPRLDRDSSFEALYRYYQDHVAIDYDTASSISVLRVTAFSAREAHDINDQLLAMGEALVNGLNARARQDLIQSAEAEVHAAEAVSTSTATALSAFRSSHSVFDPEKQGALQLTGITKIEEELHGSESQLAEMKRVSPANPQVSLLQARIESLKQRLASETARVTGAKDSLASKSAQYDQLVLRNAFAERELASALSSLETARNEALRKQLYLERLVQPNLPDRALEPRRVRSVLMVFVLGMICWGVLSMVVSSVKEHQD